MHTVLPSLTIVPGNEDYYYEFTVPEEAFRPEDGPRLKVLDISGGFANEEGPGLFIQVFDDDGKLLSEGERFRVIAAQGEKLRLHVFGKEVDGVIGAGAYTLIVNTLPQVAEIEYAQLVAGRRRPARRTDDQHCPGVSRRPIGRGLGRKPEQLQGDLVGRRPRCGRRRRRGDSRRSRFTGGVASGSMTPAAITTTLPAAARSPPRSGRR